MSEGIVWPEKLSTTPKTEGMFSAKERLKDYESYFLSKFFQPLNHLYLS